MNTKIERPLEEAKPFVKVVNKTEVFADGNSGSESAGSEGSCADSGDSASASPSNYVPLTTAKQK